MNKVSTSIEKATEATVEVVKHDTDDVFRLGGFRSAEFGVELRILEIDDRRQTVQYSALFHFLYDDQSLLKRIEMLTIGLRDWRVMKDLYLKSAFATWSKHSMISGFLRQK